MTNNSDLKLFKNIINIFKLDNQNFKNNIFELEKFKNIMKKNKKKRQKILDLQKNYRQFIKKYR